jgi:hypothetical protein
MRFSAPSALEIRKVHQHGVARSRFVPPPGFFNLLAAYSLPDPPALFHAVNAHGVFPSEPGTPDSATLLSEELPSCGCSDHQSEDQRFLPPLQGFDPSRKPYRTGERLGLPERPQLSWACCPPGLLSSHPGPRPSSHRLCHIGPSAEAFGLPCRPPRVCPDARPVPLNSTTEVLGMRRPAPLGFLTS